MKLISLLLLASVGLGQEAKKIGNRADQDISLCKNLGGGSEKCIQLNSTGETQFDPIIISSSAASNQAHGLIFNENRVTDPTDVSMSLYYDGAGNNLHITGTKTDGASAEANMTGATKHMTMNRDTGYLGLGVTDPDVPLEVQGTGGIKTGGGSSSWNTASVVQGGQASIYGDANKSYFSHNSYWDGSVWRSSSSVTNNQLFFENNGDIFFRYSPNVGGGNTITWTDQVTIKASGKVGIGTTSPNDELEISGTAGNNNLSIKRTGSTDATGAIYFRGSDDVIDASISINEFVGANNLEFRTGGTNAMVIDENQNVGIGTTNPNNPLTVSTSRSNNIVSFENNDGTSGDGVFILTSTSNSGDYLLQLKSAGVDRTFFYANGGMVHGSPSGGNKGPGTINAQAVYDDNVILTDYVFEKYYTGNAFDEQRADYEMKTLEEEIAHTKENYHLSTMIGREQWETKTSSLGELTQQLWETAETQFLYIKELHETVKELKAELDTARKEIDQLKEVIDAGSIDLGLNAVMRESDLKQAVGY